MRVYPAGAACSDESADCKTFDIPIGYSGNTVVGRWQPGLSEVAVVINDKESLRWQYRGKDHGFPQQILFTERDGQENPIDSGTFNMTSYRENEPPISKQTVIKNERHFTVMKSNVGYGYNSKSNLDPWEFYTQQKRVWARQDAMKPKKPAEGSWILGSIMIGAVVALTGFLFLRFWKR